MVGRYGSDDNAAAPNVGLNPKTLTVQSLMTELKKYREIAESLLEGSGATQTEWLEGFGHESWSDVWTGAELTRELDALETSIVRGDTNSAAVSGMNVGTLIERKLIRDLELEILIGLRLRESASVIESEGRRHTADIKARWQQLADAMWVVNPRLSKRSVAKIVSAQLATESTRYSVHTIRQSIKKTKR